MPKFKGLGDWGRLGSTSLGTLRSNSQLRNHSLSSHTRTNIMPNFEPDEPCGQCQISSALCWGKACPSPLVLDIYFIQFVPTDSLNITSLQKQIDDQKVFEILSSMRKFSLEVTCAYAHAQAYFLVATLSTSNGSQSL